MPKPEEEKTSLVIEEEVEPQVSVAEFESLSGNVTQLEGEIKSIREEIPENNDNQIAEIETNITEEVERRVVLEKITADLVGKVEVLTEAAKTVDIGTYDVEDFPYE